LRQKKKPYAEAQGFLNRLAYQGTNLSLRPQNSSFGRSAHIIRPRCERSIALIEAEGKFKVLIAAINEADGCKGRSHKFVGTEAVREDVSPE
jgi:hypothetical protein